MNKAEKPKLEKIANNVVSIVSAKGHPIDSQTKNVLVSLFNEALETAYTAGRKAQMERDAKIAEDWRESHDYEFFVGADFREVAQAIRNQGDVK